MRGTGYIADPAGHRRVPFRHLAARLGSTIPQSASLESFLPRVMDQGQSSACCGHATSAAVYAAFGAAGHELAFVPSPAGIYTVGRAIDRFSRLDGTLAPLADVGAQPNQVMRGISEYGIRPMRPVADRYSDADTATITDEPTLADLETDATEIVVGEYGLYSTGAALSDEVALALANGLPVTCAIQADGDAFQGYSGGVLGPLGTGLDHYVTLYGFEGPTGARGFSVRNSWSEGWGLSGNARISEACLAQFGDLIAMKVSAQ